MSLLLMLTLIIIVAGIVVMGAMYTVLSLVLHLFSGRRE